MCAMQRKCSKVQQSNCILLYRPLFSWNDGDGSYCLTKITYRSNFGTTHVVYAVQQYHRLPVIAFQLSTRLYFKNLKVAVIVFNNSNANFFMRIQKEVLRDILYNTRKIINQDLKLTKGITIS